MYRFDVPLLMLLLAFATSACLEDADRGNPLDPLSPNFMDEGQVAGRVLDRSLTGIGGSRVTLSPGGFNVTSDGSGNFSFSGIPTGAYTVTSDATGYETSSDTITVTLGRVAQVNFELNGLPILEDWTINTAHVSRWWPLEDLFQIEIAARASDVDGVFDVERVWLEIPEYTFADTLLATQTVGSFARTIPDLELPTSTLHSLLGRPMHLSVRDGLSVIVSSPAVQLVRVIDETPEAVDEAFQTNPQDCLQGIAPLIQWRPLFLPYSFTHRVDIIRVDSGLESLVDRIEGIPSDQTSLSVSPLPEGEYYWTVAVVDEFKNRSRSKQVGFCVIP